jgi:hypothetical protein
MLNWVYALLFTAIQKLSLAHAIKIAFVGDTGVADRDFYGYGDLTMKMCEDQGVDLVVDVGDFEYWGVCTQSFYVNRTFHVASTTGRLEQVPANAVLKRYKWQDGNHGTIKGWEIGWEILQEDEPIPFANDIESTFTPLELDRLVISHGMWTRIFYYLDPIEDCWGQPWDGPFLWNQFVRDHDFDFLGASGNSEVVLSDGYGKNETKMIRHCCILSVFDTSFIL